MKRKRTVRRAGRRAFYRTVHAVLPARIREPIRNLVRGPRPDAAETSDRDEEKHAAKDARRQRKQSRRAVRAEQQQSGEESDDRVETAARR